MQNQEIAKVFNEIADILEMQDESVFRIRSYRNAAAAIENLPEDLKSVYERGALKDISGIGESIAGKIEELLKKGACKLHTDLLKKVPRGVLEIMNVPGMGPKSAMLVYQRLKVKSVKDLQRAAAGGKLRALPRMGVKLEKKIIAGIEQLKKSEGRFKLSTGLLYAEAVAEEINKSGAVKRVEFAGSLRRKKEMIRDADILVISSSPRKVMEAFWRIDDIDRMLAKGDTKSSALLKCGLQVDVRALEPESFGSALLYFTGSKEHNIALRDMAKKKGLKVSEYGIYKGKRRIAGRTEEECYAALGLPYIAPELRENTGEIQAAKAGRLPRLVEEKDIKGDLHTHTSDTDGANTIEEMAQAGMRMGYEYMAVTNHSKAVTVAHGMDEKKLARHFKEIDEVNRNLKNFRVLKGVEVDIKSDGSLDLDEEILEQSDIVIAAVHSKFNMPQAEMTDRVIKAMRNRNVNILAHPTGRLLKERPAYQIDMEAVMRAAGEYKVAMELNAHPDRLDLNDTHCRLAKKMGVKISVNTDAHSIINLDNIRFGVYTARRGWLEQPDIVNTLPIKQLLSSFQK